VPGLVQLGTFPSATSSQENVFHTSAQAKALSRVRVEPGEKRKSGQSVFVSRQALGEGKSPHSARRLHCASMYATHAPKRLPLAGVAPPVPAAPPTPAGEPPLPVPTPPLPACDPPSTGAKSPLGESSPPHAGSTASSVTNTATLIRPFWVISGVIRKLAPILPRWNHHPVAPSRRFVKICGVTSVDDAVFAVEAGADAVGVNLVPASPRRVDPSVAKRIAESSSDRVLVVAVVADLPIAALRAVRESTGIEWLQLHGSETNETLLELLPRAFKAVRIGDAGDVTVAETFQGDRLLVDAKVAGHLGGTGATFDWALVRALSKSRKVILAGGLTPENVRDAIRAVDPWGVDVASGVERVPGVKDSGKVRAFIEAVRAADQP
jgi:phosphoribosylanthranilate isomerase